MNVLVIGSSNTDMIIQVPRIPKPGETILGGTFNIAAGGKGANQAVAAARAGGKVTFVARVGNDMFGQQAIDGFDTDGIDTQYIIKDEQAPSGVAEIFVAANGENSIAVASGANANLSPADVDSVESVIAKSNILVLQLESPLETVLQAVKIAKKHHVPVILNPAPAQSLPDELLANISVFTPNESEAELLSGIPQSDENFCKKTTEIFRSKGIPIVILTRGSLGVFVSSDELDAFIPAFDAKAVDTTAAGDVFNGALAVALAKCEPLEKSIEFAQAASALSITKLGAQPSAPSHQSILEFIKQQR